MAKSTKAKGRNTGRAAKAGPAASGRAQRPSTKADSEDDGLKRPSRPSAKDAAARAVSKGPAKGGSGRSSDGSSGATTPLAKTGGTKPAGDKAPPVKRVPAPSKRTTPPASARYTPPIPKSQKVSPLWVPILMFACLGLGMLIIVLNYVNVLPGKNPSNAYLMIGLALITVGFVTATKYH
jgi:hypothetical protein